MVCVVNRRQYICRQPTTSNVAIVAAPIDPDDLIDAHSIAELLGLSHRSSVSTYRKRHADFPEPVVDMGAGRCLLWLRADIEAWARTRRDT